MSTTEHMTTTEKAESAHAEWHQSLADHTGLSDARLEALAALQAAQAVYKDANDVWEMHTKQMIALRVKHWDLRDSLPESEAAIFTQVYTRS